MLFLALSLSAELVEFQKIQTLEKRLVALFFDSSKDNKEALTLFESFEAQYPESAFYIIDKENKNNSQVFEHKEFHELPRLFVLIPEEHMAEPMKEKFTKENAKSFLELKFTKPDMQNAVKINNKTTQDAFKKDGFVVFVYDECKRCDNILFAIARAVTIKKQTLTIVNCDATPEFCEELGIYNFPTIWIALDGVPSQSGAMTTITALEDWEKATTTEREPRKSQKIPKQVKPKEQKEQEAPQQQEQIMITDTKSRVTELEKKVDKLEKMIKKLQSEKKETKKEL
ncbi:Conserved_hypothetical protein [Hexamita inflata]|uniref:Thioredoxin domain-containing protein n=1 Tax=Hexamita inflata TaxID=28002 RepID=A0AA86UX98_9EUKA|nr:Conserved hypothetical protein [Hexamita inflata]